VRKSSTWQSNLSPDSNPLVLLRSTHPEAMPGAMGARTRWLRGTLLDRYVLQELIGPFLCGGGRPGRALWASWTANLLGLLIGGVLITRAPS